MVRANNIIAMPEVTLQQAFDLAVQHHQSGRLAEAEALYRQILAVESRHADALHHLGIIAHQVGRNDLAVDMIRQAIDLRPDLPSAHNNLGNALQRDGKLDEAIAAYRQALFFNSANPVAHNNLGVALREKGHLDEAIAGYRQALILRPDYAEAHGNLGNALGSKGDLDGAIAACLQALTFKPDYPDALNDLGTALRENSQVDEALAAYRQAIALKPDYAEAHNNLANTLKDMGRLDEAITTYRQAIALKPDYAEAHSNLVFCMNNHPGLGTSAITEEHLHWNRRHGEPLRSFILPHTNDRSHGRRLRIGYVSPDFREHSVAYFIEGLLENHDRTQVEVFCYSNVIHPDAVTARIQQLAGHWHSITDLPHAEVAKLIRNDGIDILVDLAGHTAKNRLLTFARKPAPVQVTWLGYSNKTWLDTIDYRLTDAFADPPGSSDELPGEQLVRLPKTFACFRPADDAPPVNPLPAADRGWVTFASFHMLAKINDPLLEYWAEILTKVSGSRLMMVAWGLDEPSTRERFTTFFGSRGIEAGRLKFMGRQALASYLALHHEVDVLLDSHPFSGHTMSCHALWMGVPVVTLAGRTHCSRMVASVLRNVGLAELIAESPEQYVQLAVKLANDLPRLATLRSTLREKMQASPLMDAPRFARDMESAYRNMWRKWCEQPESQPCPK